MSDYPARSWWHRGRGLSPLSLPPLGLRRGWRVCRHPLCTQCSRPRTDAQLPNPGAQRGTARVVSYAGRATHLRHPRVSPGGLVAAELADARVRRAYSGAGRERDRHRALCPGPRFHARQRQRADARSIPSHFVLDTTYPGDGIGAPGRHVDVSTDWTYYGMGMFCGISTAPEFGTQVRHLFHFTPIPDEKVMFRIALSANLETIPQELVPLVRAERRDHPAQLCRGRPDLAPQVGTSPSPCCVTVTDPMGC